MTLSRPSLDPRDVTAACFQLESPKEAWLQATARALRPLLDQDDFGVVSAFFQCPDPCSLKPELVVTEGVPDRLLDIYITGFQALNPTYVSATFATGGMGRGASFPGWDAIGPVRDGSLKAFGAEDAMSLCVVEPDGAGIVISSFRKRSFELSEFDLLSLARCRREVSAAHRLRRRFGDRAPTSEEAQAVITEGGKVVHAVGAATEPHELDALSRAARELDGARGPRRDAGAANALVSSRWTLVNHYERDGKRFLLAVENLHTAPHLGLLSTREREVLARALAGETNKVIAYDLGIAHSTVRVLLHRAVQKLGARTRDELLEKASSLIVKGSSRAMRQRLNPRT